MYVFLTVLSPIDVRCASFVCFFNAGTLRVFLCLWYVSTLLFSNSLEKFFSHCDYLPFCSRSTGVKTLWGIFPGNAWSFWMDSLCCQVFCFHYNIFPMILPLSKSFKFLHHQNYCPIWKGLESWILIKLHNWHLAVGCRYYYCEMKLVDENYCRNMFFRLLNYAKDFTVWESCSQGVVYLELEFFRKLPIDKVVIASEKQMF